MILIDFETKEQFDIVKFGSSWAWGGCMPLCCSLVDTDKPDDETEFYTDWTKLAERLKDVKVLGSYNVMFDMGVLLQLGIDISDKQIIDPMIMVYFYNSNMGRSLENVMSNLLNEHKSDKPLALYAIRHRLYIKGFLRRNCRLRAKARRKFIAKFGDVREATTTTRSGNIKKVKQPIFVRCRPKGKAKDTLFKGALKWVKCNMDVMWRKCPQIVEKYCIDDSVGAKKIYNKLKDQVDWKLVELFSYTLKGLLKARKRGVRVDNKKLQHARDLLFMKETDVAEKMYKIFNEEYSKKIYIESFKKGFKGFKITSQQRIVNFLLEKGYKPEYDDDTKRYSIAHDWLVAMKNSTNDPIFNLILLHRKYFIARNHFCDKIITFQQLTGKWGDDYGRIHPQINPFGADNTGRASASCPNIQQMPAIADIKDDPVSNEIGMLVRGVFLPEDGETWYSLDWMAQEPRLHVHFGVAENIGSAWLLAEKWKQEPDMDIHMVVAQDIEPNLTEEQLKPKRKTYKVIALGIAYCKGEKSLAEELGVSREEARVSISNYVAKYSYIKEQSSKLTMDFKTIGFITTLLGRKLFCPKPYWDKKQKRHRDLSYKAFNYRIQGSGADMCYVSIAIAEMCNIPILFPVHDEINISSKTVDDAIKLKYIMETSLDLNVPMLAEVGAGSSWANACINEVKI